MERKFINGKRYDTGTASICASACAPLGDNDPYFYSEVLYKKVTGEFFLHGIGGSMTRYARRNSDENYFTGGDDIIPLTLEQAKVWFERNQENFYDCCEDVSSGDIFDNDEFPE